MPKKILIEIDEVGNIRMESDVNLDCDSLDIDYFRRLANDLGGVVKALQALEKYADAKVGSISYRMSGTIQVARICEKDMEKFFSKLPRELRW